MLTIDSLKEKIESKRNEMIQTGCKYGMNHSKTISISDELDRLINLFLFKKR
ncbi:aspartyl-phosphate phosphatase Spo0E family protein [Bacillus sp. J37]|uniref:aspartyl-phosphate phosphatase Spo0E family protein n=1 Tax=Bacillus sp. J37 TaxID=935837 RepID=UPI0004B69146|nr:aspartyl-phosphate phosphatase Spo0E family protein [Bacillus sp. J37]